MGLLMNKVQEIASAYVTPYPQVGIEPYCGVTEEDLNPLLNGERVTFYENHLSKKYFEEDDDPVCGPDLEEEDSVFLKLNAARCYLKKIEDCVKQHRFIQEAVKSNPKYIDTEQQKQLLVPITIMVTPAMAWNIIHESQRDLANMLKTSEQILEAL